MRSGDRVPYTMHLVRKRSARWSALTIQKYRCLSCVFGGSSQQRGLAKPSAQPLPTVNGFRRHKGSSRVTLRVEGPRGVLANGAELSSQAMIRRLALVHELVSRELCNHHG